MIAGSSIGSSVCSALDNQKSCCDDLYSESILVSSMVREAEDLVDKDLLNLLAYIKNMPLPSIDQI